MPEFKETVEEVRQEEASIRKLFGGDNRVRDRRRTPEYANHLVEAADFIYEVEKGRRPMYHLQEAMTTSDFPLLFADILDRQMLAAYREVQPVWQNYIRRSVVPDFRNVKRLAVDGAEGRLPEVDEREEYPEGELIETKDEYHVRKYGKRLDLSWEAMVNDDLDAFRRNPERLARGARRTEQFLATQLYVDEDGPHADLYTGGFDNIVPGNPALTLEGITAGLQTLNEQRDPDGEPIMLDFVHLVVPPALQVTAESILNAALLRLDIAGGQMETNNWLRNRLRLWVDPYIPFVATGPEGQSSWFLFADPNSGRSFAEMGFLRGYEDPALYERDSDARLIGGGAVPESFSDDSIAWRVRHVVGGGQLLATGGAQATAASDGSGS
jgi:hypothetical protein